ncbi:glycosyltransferase [Fictibacillus barbaricus]|uniref:Glycosyltransferase involved in cell wall biosynthesis n=1 Tax=Fictibacillus barbaricus TaxID=182136 RepID=A0ABU1U175_9BACL|nr:glycosyltransferase [Fictibacillus barbaricus]MDR7073183.1 glycosyltransferase involved in cell wall biosynthesis [Fictibacillus barbaricus]
MEKKRKVVHLTTVHHPFDPRIFHKQCKSLHEAGFDVNLIVSEHPDLKKQDDYGFNIITIPKVKNRFTRIFKSSYLAYKEAKKLDADIYHFHDPELILIGNLLKNDGNTVVYDIHEDYETSIKQKTYLPKPVAKMLSKIYRFIEKRFTKSFEIVLAEKYYSEKFPHGALILNYPIIENHNFQKESHTLPNNSVYHLIYTGNVTLDRGALIHGSLPLIDDKIHVNFVGKCSSELAQKIFDASEHRRENIVIDGVNTFIPREKINEKYQEGKWLAGLALFPPTEHYAKKELTKFFEYMNVGLPIICSNFPVWKDFVEKYGCGIAVDPFNKDEIKDAIKYLANNPTIAKEMGLRGQEAVRKELSWNSQSIKLTNFYKSFI